jgi:hypothetical protein
VEVVGAGQGHEAALRGELAPQIGHGDVVRLQPPEHLGEGQRAAAAGRGQRPEGRGDLHQPAVPVTRHRGRGPEVRGDHVEVLPAHAQDRGREVGHGPVAQRVRAEDVRGDPGRAREPRRHLALVHGQRVRGGGHHVRPDPSGQGRGHGHGELHHVPLGRGGQVVQHPVRDPVRAAVHRRQDPAARRDAVELLQVEPHRAHPLGDAVGPGLHPVRVRRLGRQVGPGEEREPGVHPEAGPGRAHVDDQRGPPHLARQLGRAVAEQGAEHGVLVPHRDRRREGAELLRQGAAGRAEIPRLGAHALDGRL